VTPFRWTVARPPERDLLLDAPPPDWLSPAEAAALSRLRFPERRTKWLAGRWAAKSLLAVELGPLPLPEIVILNEESGAPYAEVRGRRFDRFSISHRGNFGFCAVTGEEAVSLGADLELIEPRDRALVRQFFTEDEQRAVAASPSPILAINRIWSVKEAAMKALRTGLRIDTRDVLAGDDLPPAPDTPQGWTPLRISFAGEGAKLAAGHSGGAAALWRDEGRYLLSIVVLGS